MTDGFYLGSPVKLVLPVGVELRSEFAVLQKKLTYEDKRVTYQYLKWRKVQKKDDVYIQNGYRGYRDWFVDKFGRQALDDKVAQLAKDRHGICLFFENGRYWVYSGLQKLVEEILGQKANLTPSITPDSWGLVPWNIKPHEPRDYQSKAVDLLVPLDGSRTHGSVSSGTGTGKSLMMLLIAQRIGLETVVVVPTRGIGYQMVKNFYDAFGKGKVGQFFDSKKQSDKFFVIAVSNSLANVEKGSKDWDNLSNRKVVLCDEAHLAPPESLSTVMFDLLSQVPYRYFFSGTMFRNDGLGLLLQGIAGDVVFEYSVKQGIEENALAPLKFFQWQITSDSKISCDDPIKLNKKHLQENDKVYKHAANLINRAVLEKNRRVLVLVDGLGQFKRLLNGGLIVPAKFAHAGVTKTNQKEVPKEYWKSDPMLFVEQFDKGEFPVLVGTSCIGIGVDVCSADFIVSIVGLTSEIEISQGAGRGTRKFPGKIDCHYHDYCIANIEKLARHGKIRREIFDSIYGQCRIMEVK